MKELVERHVAVITVRDIGEVRRDKRRNYDAVVVAFCHGVDEVLKVHFCWVFSCFTTSIHKSDAISLADGIIKHAFRL